VDSATEHYRGSFENPGMYAPLLVSALALAAERLEASWPELKWTRPEGYHITLAFLGEIDGKSVECAKAAIDAAAAARPVDLVFEGLLDVEGPAGDAARPGADEEVGQVGGHAAPFFLTSASTASTLASVIWP